MPVEGRQEAMTAELVVGAAAEMVRDETAAKPTATISREETMASCSMAESGSRVAAPVPRR
jgi:hypothetical protein